MDTLTDPVLEAIAMAGEAHRHQKRKVDGQPYIAHPLAVAMILRGVGAPDHLVIAGILHDVLEDTELPPARILAAFGAKVLGLVQDVSEDKGIHDWKARKSAYLAHLRVAGDEAVLLSAADKYHNLFSMHRDFSRHGEGLWMHFKRGRNDQSWYYTEVRTIFHERSILEGTRLMTDIDHLAQALFAP